VTFETNDNYSKFQIIAQLFDSIPTIPNEKNTIRLALVYTVVGIFYINSR